MKKKFTIILVVLDSRNMNKKSRNHVSVEIYNTFKPNKSQKLVISVLYCFLEQESDWFGEKNRIKTVCVKPNSVFDIELFCVNKLPSRKHKKTIVQNYFKK